MSWTHKTMFSFHWDSLDSAKRQVGRSLATSVQSCVWCRARPNIVAHLWKETNPQKSRFTIWGALCVLWYFISYWSGVAEWTTVQLDLHLLLLICWNGSLGMAEQRLLNDSAESFSCSVLIHFQSSSTDTCAGLLSTKILASILLCCTLLGSTIFTQRVNLFHLASFSPNLFLYSHGVLVLCWTPDAWSYKILTLI